MDPSTSTDLVLRSQAPPFLAQAWIEASSPLGDARSRLARRVRLVDAGLRWLVALLLCDAQTAGRALGPQCRVLEHQLQRPAMGVWMAALFELAKAPPPASVVPIHEHLWSEGKAADPLQALQDLVTTRNLAAHYEGAFVGREEEAEELLAASDGAIRRFMVCPRLAARYPLVAGIPDPFPRLLWLQGREVHELGPAPFDLPPNLVAVVGAGGRLLDLRGWVSWTCAPTAPFPWWASRPRLRVRGS